MVVKTMTNIEERRVMVQQRQVACATFLYAYWHCLLSTWHFLQGTPHQNHQSPPQDSKLWSIYTRKAPYALEQAGKEAGKRFLTNCNREGVQTTPIAPLRQWKRLPMLLSVHHNCCCCGVLCTSCLAERARGVGEIVNRKIQLLREKEANAVSIIRIAS